MSEIEPFPRAVLKHHYPETPLHGDFTTIQQGDYEPIDVLVGGTPCQSYSIAGLRGGLSDERGNLTLEYLKLAGRLRPEWLVWENVPGVFSSLSHDAPDPCQPPDYLEEGAEWVGEDEYDADESHAFACFLAGLSELGYGWSYRICDAQYWGLAQRRKRVFVVARLGDWSGPAKVLSLRESLRWNPPPSRETRERVAPTLESRTDAGGSGWGTDWLCDGGAVTTDDVAFGGNRLSGPIDVATALTAHGGPHGRMDFERETFIVPPLRASARTAAADGNHTEADSLVTTKAHADVAQTMASGYARNYNHHEAVSSHLVTSDRPLPMDTHLGGDIINGLDANYGKGPGSRGAAERPVVVTHSLRADDTKACSVDGCGSRQHAGGMCRSHYARFKRHGDPLGGRVNEGEPLAFLLSYVKHAENECVLWPYAQLATGYGCVEYEGKTNRVHRLMCEKAHGAALSPELDAAHSCGNRLCINPTHLRWATRGENMADAIEHGTTTRGERHANHKLKEADVLDIKRRLNEGETHDGIAAAYEVSRNAITDIAKRKNWAWLSGVEVAHTLRADGFDSSEDGTGRGTPIIAETTNALTKQHHMDGQAGREDMFVGTASAVRRLTPREAERLQGFCDDYTMIPFRGREAADGPRYKSLGNSFAVPVVRWLGQRIQMVAKQ